MIDEFFLHELNYTLDPNKIVKDKTILMGEEHLIPKSDWIPFDEMDTSAKILNNEIFERAFLKILDLHAPKNKVAFVSLCTSTRPYQYSRKWSEFKKKFGNMADMVVLSNGGIIPEKFWTSYPYMNYDGVADISVRPIFNRVTEDRLIKFFTRHQYEFVLANFRPTMPNLCELADITLGKLKKNGKIKDYIVLPTAEQYQDLQDRGFPGGKMFPDLDEDMVQSFINALIKFNSLADKNFKHYNPHEIASLLF